MSYEIKGRLRVNNEESIPILKPDHVSLGKCVICHQFVRKYATINDIGVVNLLRDGCKFNGFKKIIIESSEEEGFANMHHVVLLSSLDGDVQKEVCIRQFNNLNINVVKLKEKNNAVTDTNSVVLFTYNRERFLEFFHFANKKVKHYKMELPGKNFKAFLTCHVLYMIFDDDYRDGNNDDDHVWVINFKYNKPFKKILAVSPETYVVSLSSILFVTCHRSLGMSTLCCDFLEKEASICQVVVPQNILTDLRISRTMIVPAIDNILWISSNFCKCSIYMLTKSQDLTFCRTICLNLLYPNAERFQFERSCYCASTQQAFLLYIKDEQKSSSSFIIVLDLQTLKVISILEMELTLNRKPHLLMYPSRDGSKLFVQETFDNRVIFYQVFSLIPSDFRLKSITKQYVWKTFTEDDIKHANIPADLIKQLLLGY